MAHYHRFMTALSAAALAYPPPGAWQPPGRPGAVRLNAGYPFDAAVPVEAIARAVEATLAAEGPLPFFYLGSGGMQRLPGQLQAWSGPLAREGDAVLVTAGALQAIDLVARLLLGPDDAVAVEAPTYMEALEIFRNYTPHILAYAVDAQGLDVAALAADLGRRRRAGERLPRLLYTIPTFQNPTGRVLSPERRQALLALAAEYDFLIAEDDPYGALWFAAPPPPLKALDWAGRVIYLGSLSKVIAPGLRIGWALGPAELVRAMGVFKKDLDHPFAWAVTSHLLDRWDLAAHVVQLRRAYAARCRLLLDCMEKELPPGLTWQVPQGGFFVWVELPPHVDGEALLPAALDAGVAFVPGRHCFWRGTGGRNHIRLSFSHVPEGAMALGVRRLGGVLRQALAQGHS